MNGTARQLVQPLAYRVWDPDRHTFFYSDVRPESAENLDRWTGLFDKQGAPIYEHDIIRVHFDWKLGWVRAEVKRLEKTDRYFAEATGPDGCKFLIGFYCFAEGYRVGNVRQHPHRLVPASEQFAEDENAPWWLSSAIFRTTQRSCLN